MKHKIVLVPFPFDDLSAVKVRPALCLTNESRPYGHIVVAFITSRVFTENTSDLVLDSTEPDFVETGLHVSSTIRLHRLVTISKSIVKRELGRLSEKKRLKVDENLRNLFKL